MHNEYKRQSPYRGMWVMLPILILVPLGLFMIVNAVLKEYSSYPDAFDLATAKAMGCFFGFLFHMICVISGVLTDGWEAVKYRMGEFVENLIIGVGYAFRSYLESMRDDGVVFIIYSSVIIANFAVLADGVSDVLALLPTL